MAYNEEKLKRISDDFEDRDPVEVLAWALDEFDGDIALASSFGAEDVALIDMLSKVSENPKIFYLDTNFLFKETYETRDRIIERYGFQPKRYAPELSPEGQEAKYGERLWEKDADLCCNLRKVEPLKEALEGLSAWITGMRREQSPTRANIGIVEWDRKFGLVKVNPLAGWTSKQVWSYIMRNNVPYNPLHDQGYPSIGCVHCTNPVGPGEDPRSGRWRSSNKIECGLHK